MRYLPVIDRWPTDDRLYTKVYVVGQKQHVVWTHALIDTGATGFAAISSKLAHEAKAAFVSQKRSDMWGMEGRIHRREAGVGIRCEPTYCRAIVDVLDGWKRVRGECPHEMVIGQDWLEAFGTVIDLERRTIAVRRWKTRDLK